jgi:hypothetical protein
VTLDEFVAEVCERLRADMQSIRHPEGDIHPALFYSFDGESIRRFKIPRSWFETRGSKDVMAHAIEQATTLARPRMIAFESTAWIVHGDVADGIDRDIRPSEHPDRKEIVHVIALDRAEHIYAAAEIERDGRNPPSFGAFDVIRADHIEGALWEPLQRGMQG